MKYIGIIMLAIVLPIVAMGVPSSKDPITDFMGNYCLDCHDEETQKGKLSLETFSSKTDLRGILDVYDQVVLEYMPPEKKKQPSAEERERFVFYLESLLAEKGYNRKTQAGLGNYVDHEKLFTPNDLKPRTGKRVWRVDPSAMAEIANRLIGRVVYRQQRQGVTKEHPSFAYRAPAHTFQDFAATSYFENTTTELALSYAKEIEAFFQVYPPDAEMQKKSGIRHCISGEAPPFAKALKQFPLHYPKVGRMQNITGTFTWIRNERGKNLHLTFQTQSQTYQVKEYFLLYRLEQAGFSAKSNPTKATLGAVWEFDQLSGLYISYIERLELR